MKNEQIKKIEKTINFHGGDRYHIELSSVMKELRDNSSVNNGDGGCSKTIWGLLEHYLFILFILCLKLTCI